MHNIFQIAIPSFEKSAESDHFYTHMITGLAGNQKFIKYKTDLDEQKFSA